jgi:hypothetical protein
MTPEEKYWKDKYDHQYAQFLSLRTLYNKTIREYDHPEIRLLKAKLHDKSYATLGS